MGEEGRRFDLDIGEQGWRSGKSAHFPPMCPGFDSQTPHHVWVEFVVFSSLLQGFFSEFSGFPPSSKPNISKFQFDLEVEGHGVCQSP